jgi:hypothetical protein
MGPRITSQQGSCSYSVTPSQNSADCHKTYAYGISDAEVIGSEVWVTVLLRKVTHGTNPSRKVEDDVRERCTWTEFKGKGGKSIVSQELFNQLDERSESLQTRHQECTSLLAWCLPFLQPRQRCQVIYRRDDPWES